MKRILIFNDCLYMGGTEILLVDILNYLAEKDCEVTLLLPNPSERNVLLKNVSKKINIYYIYPQILGRYKRKLYNNLLFFFPKLYAKIFKIKPKDFDLIICFKDCIYSVMFSKMKTDKILWIHNQPFARTFDSKNIYEWMAVQLSKIHIKLMLTSYAKYDQIICVSDVSKNNYTKIINREDIKVLYNTLDFDKIKQKSEETTPIQTTKRLTFILATRLSPEKRIDRMIEVTQRLIEEGYSFDVLILGDGYEVENINKLIKSYKLQNVIKMLGFIQNPYPYIKQSDWLVCTSDRESFSLVLLEAISLNTPVITTDCGGPTYIIENGKYGILTENNTEGLYEGIKKALDTPQLLQYYTSKKEECLARFDRSKWLESIDKIINSNQKIY